MHLEVLAHAHKPTQASYRERVEGSVQCAESKEDVQKPKKKEIQVQQIQSHEHFQKKIQKTVNQNDSFIIFFLDE